MNRKRVYIIDNDEISLSLYSNLIATDAIEVVQFDSSESFLEEFDESLPSCALIDLGVGASVYTEMLSKNIDIPTIFMSSNYDVSSVVDLFREGAYDCIGKNYSDCVSLSKKINDALIVGEKSHIHRIRVKEYSNMMAKLTERESDILHLIASGITAKIIARQLKISYKTVECHLANVRRKTQKDTLDLISAVLYQKIPLTLAK